MKAADFWEKAFRSVMTFLVALGVSFASAIFKSNQDMQLKLARIESTMPNKEDLAAISNKIFNHETRILTVELTCRKMSRNHL